MNQTVTANRSCSRGRWSPLNIVLMVLGFALFWPLGLAMLAWMIWGEELARFGGDMRDQARSTFGAGRGKSHSHHFGARETGNVAFDEYRAREMERLEEERRKIESMRSEFEGFMKELRRAKDKEEFDRFMEEYRRRTSAGEHDAAI
ncbi:DUF2852 domain-containing protein [Afifella sp. IM 167]|uniref:DUF2852 domain-containing protein n=1 Tax=Afifella sp. IM 167 TaxID=2033586 RepID=UPI001CCD4939|nr:DUF2852 domain-containing protein [Afifella sp. IM 167]MBZ8133646.1 hypothetical protein [Afifella sp. IM 167]